MSYEVEYQNSIWACYGGVFTNLAVSFQMRSLVFSPTTRSSYISQNTSRVKFSAGDALLEPVSSVWPRMNCTRCDGASVVEDTVFAGFKSNEWFKSAECSYPPLRLKCWPLFLRPLACPLLSELPRLPGLDLRCRLRWAGLVLTRFMAWCCQRSVWWASISSYSGMLAKLPWSLKGSIAERCALRGARYSTVAVLGEVLYSKRTNCGVHNLRVRVNELMV